MDIYLVGGAVRDVLLGRPVVDKDWVVVGATPEAMLDMGYQPVGKDFPVFLHPQTQEEYALARTEKKTAPGYQGFVFHAAPDVSLLEDLKRRDLTINAMARDTNDQLIDPHQGLKDIQAKKLRHVSSAFSEDPVRILRVARFASTLPDFSVHPETMALMQGMVACGEVDALVAERIWQEFHKALAQPAPQRFVEVLVACGAWSVLCPELPEHQHISETLLRAGRLSSDPMVRFAACFAMGQKGVIKQFSCRFRPPKSYQQLAALVQACYEDFSQVPDLDAAAVLDLVLRCDVLRRPRRFMQWLLACQANSEPGGKRSESVGILRAVAQALLKAPKPSVNLQDAPHIIAAKIKADQLAIVQKLKLVK